MPDQDRAVLTQEQERLVAQRFDRVVDVVEIGQLDPDDDRPGKAVRAAQPLGKENRLRSRAAARHRGADIDAGLGVGFQGLEELAIRDVDVLGRPAVR